MSDATQAPRWSREDVQRVLYHVRAFLRAGAQCRWRQRTAADAIRIGRQTFIDNDWWPE